MRLQHCQPQWSPGDMPVDSFGTGGRPESSTVKRLFGTSVFPPHGYGDLCAATSGATMISL